MSLLGVDVGTSGCKAVAFDLEGRVIASAYREYPLLEPHPGWQELDAHQVAQAVREVIREVGAQTPRDPIQALSASSQGEAAVPLSEKGEILDNTPVSFDKRTAEIAAWWREQLGLREIFEITGQPLHPMYTICKIMWLRDNRPEVFNRVHKFLCYEEFVFHLLGVAPVTDYSVAARTMAFDVRSKHWSERMLSVAGLDESLFPSVAPSGTPIGQVPSKAANALGLPKGVLVVTGGHDQPCNALGAGIIHSGAAVYGTGTVECITPAISWPDDVEEMLKGNLACYPHVVRGLFTSVAFNFTGGSLLRWYRDTFGEKEKEVATIRGMDPYEVILEQLPDQPAGPMVLPHFTSTGTPYFDTRSKGAILGLTLGTRKADIVKAILEGVTFEMKVNLEVLEHAGVPVRSMRATGGGAKSRAWIQLKADIMGIPVASLEVSEATSLGTAILAGAAAGVYPSVESAVEQLVKTKEVFSPDPGKVRTYEERFATYKRIYPAIREISYEL